MRQAATANIALLMTGCHPARGPNDGLGSATPTFNAAHRPEIMNAMSSRAAGAATLAGVAIICASIAWFLVRQHSLDHAGAWAGIIGLALGVPLAVYGLWLAIKPSRRLAPPLPSQHHQTNNARDGGTVYAVQQGDQHIGPPGDHDEAATSARRRGRGRRPWYR